MQPDPDKVGGVEEAPFVRLPNPAQVFSDRARRFASLAQGHPLEAYLLFLSRITEAQHAAQAALPAPQPPDRDRLTQTLQNTMPPLSQDMLQDNKGFTETLIWLLDNFRCEEAPAAAREAQAQLTGLSQQDRLALARDVFAAAYQVGRLGESLYVAAAVQVYLTRQATMLDATALRSVADGVCPTCGGAPVANIIVGWTQASKARYLCCSICSTLWNYVRIKCTVCSSTDGISYYNVDGGSENLAAETCTACRSYLKHLHQHSDPRIEPFADDVASYGLDLLIQQQDFRRSGVNPLFVAEGWSRDRHTSSNSASA
jgi:FdhE protein